MQFKMKTILGGYDAVNRYGDELQSKNGNSFLGSSKIVRENLGLGQFHRTGYLEKDYGGLQYL
jgi:hypothetical protein